MAPHKTPLEQQEIAKRLRHAGELGLCKADACTFAGITVKYFERHKTWCKVVYEEGQANRSARFYAGDFYTLERLAKRQAYFAKTRKEGDEVTPEELEIMSQRHKLEVDERRRRDRENNYKLRYKQYKLEKQKLDQLNTVDAIMDYIPTAREMTPEELRAYTAEDYDVDE